VEYGVAVTVEALEQFASGTLSDAPLARLGQGRGMGSKDSLN